LQLSSPQFRQPLIWLVCLGVLLPVASSAQTNPPASAPASLSTAAQQIVNKGIFAAKQQDYLLAIRYFNDARKIAPDAPEIYFDLGLAESKIPGRELRAIAWFGAYLAANPDAPNTAAVRDQIEALDVKGQGNVSRVIKSVQDQAGQKGIKASSLILVAGLWAEARDLAGALKVANQIQDADDKDEARAAIARIQVRAGDIAGAFKIANQIQAGFWRSSAQTAIAEAQVKARDIAGAKSTLAAALESIQQIPSEYPNGTHKSIAQATVADAFVKVGDLASAQNMLAAAVKTANQIVGDAAADKAIARIGEVLPNVHMKPDIWVDALRAASQIQEAVIRIDPQIAIAEAQLYAGDIAGALSTLAIALKTADRIGEPGTRFSKQPGIKDLKAHSKERIARLQVKAGDIVGALKTANQIQPPYWKSATQTDIAEGQMKAGDIASAKNTLAASLRTASQNQPALGKSRALVRIARFLVKLGDVPGARGTLEAALKAGEQSEYPDARVLARALVAEASAEISAEVQIKAGDIDGAIGTLTNALKAFDQISDDDEKAVARGNVAGLLAKAGDSADAKSTLTAALNTADQINHLDERHLAQVDITEALAKLASTSQLSSTATSATVTQAAVDEKVRVITASDWLRKLDDGFVYGDCPLNTDLFLDLAGYLKALPTSNDPDEVFMSLSDTASKLVKAQNAVDKMLGQQAKQ
jgi:tetratricopeptide (TPR) repeat protein